MVARKKSSPVMLETDPVTAQAVREMFPDAPLEVRDTFQQEMKWHYITIASMVVMLVVAVLSVIL